MNHTFLEIIAPIYQKKLTPSLIISTTIPKEAILIRLLTGNLKIRNDFTNEEYSQQMNYAILGKEFKRTPSTKPIRNALSNPLKLNDLENYLVKTNHNNDSYYNLLIEEFCAYFISKQRNSYTKAFLHLYRILEYISYSFPLVYSSFSRDYFGTYGKLKNYFDTSKNELLFFDAFLEKTLDDTLLDSEIDFNFSSLPSLLARNYYQIIKNYISESNLITNTKNVSLSFQYRYLFKLIVDIRNRYFHFAVGGQRNIKSTEIVESDIFFKLINEELINWISIIYFEILNHSISQVR
ncbi:hypothetical protein [Chryseobacterium sp. sg2396]|uniref:hypothetical protein n=1 Tax=Chryseobacterium sp. sg2396 TaxID=3276280 RepID=UPI003671DF00